MSDSNELSKILGYLEAAQLPYNPSLATRYTIVEPHQIGLAPFVTGLPGSWAIDGSGFAISVRGTEPADNQPYFGEDMVENLGVLTSFSFAFNAKALDELHQALDALAGRNVTVIGYSLGGFYAQQARFRAGEVITFNSPGVGGLPLSIVPWTGHAPNVTNFFPGSLDVLSLLIQGVGQHQGSEIFVPGAETHYISDLDRAFSFQVSYDNFHGGVSLGNWAPIPQDVSVAFHRWGVANDWLSNAGLTPEELSVSYRMQLASDFDQGLTGSQARALQIRTFEAMNYTRREAEVLTAYREALKFGSVQQIDTALQALSDMSQTPPDELDKVWAFCFAGDTPVAMADGSHRPIADVAVGDEVLAFSVLADGGRGPMVPRRVTRLFRNVTDEWLELSSGLVVTPGHFFLTTDGTFEPISRILATRGGEVVLDDGSIARLTTRRVRYSDETADLYPTTTVHAVDSEGALARAPQPREGWATPATVPALH